MYDLSESVVYSCVETLQFTTARYLRTNHLNVPNTAFCEQNANYLTHWHAGCFIHYQTQQNIKHKGDKTMKIIKNHKDLDIRNIDAMPRGLNAKYLEVINGLGTEYVAKCWRRTLPNGNNKNIILIE